MQLRAVMWIFLLFSAFSNQGLRVNIIFSPESEKYLTAVEEYRQIWQQEGEKFLTTIEQVTKMRFMEKEVRAIVFEGPSSSGGPKTPMKMRASYPNDVKKAALIHELGHRLNFQLRNRPKELDEHRILFLYLYDVWERLYGKEFADKQVEIERGRKGLYDYDSAWKWALTMSVDERASKLREIVQNNRLM